MFAGSFRLIFLQTGKARTEEHFVALLDAFGERISFAEQVLRSALRRFQALLGLLFAG